ncbi:heavy metal-associated isoprenylated plant protein 31 isoform X1 [Cucurbita moschata]|uniref:Heavy metal-associated isoprenylated plant protein 31 isoform X1 n=2 Tax=Cucurbita moschata TaxID=3662 RepID=A0A6J1F0F2_CUCMO|nr:heavy metal-associated isoprenylated plant protein 31 isoform X1 [Cucurbita moschata]
MQPTLLINNSSTTMSMIEVRVPNLDCEGCASKLRKALFKLKGVEEVEVEIEMQKITVRGYGLEERKVVKAIKRAGKAAEAWPFPGYSSHYASFYKYPSYIATHYYDAYSATTNPTATNHHASPTSLHTFFQTPSLYSRAVSSDHAIASLFSDDNPHACSIM